MTENTPYESPSSDLTNSSFNLADKTVFFSAKQRIGRLRWLVYGAGAQVGMTIVLTVAVAIFILVFGINEGDLRMSFVTMIIGLLFYLGSFILAVLYNNRRLHDVGKSGWLNLLILVPVLNLLFILYLLFAPGDKQSNRFGSQPSPNSIPLWIAGLFIPIAFLGLFASIALPAYDEYVARTKAVQTKSNDG